MLTFTGTTFRIFLIYEPCLFVDEEKISSNNIAGFPLTSQP